MKCDRMGFFSEKLNDAMRQRDLSGHSVAELANCSYEHVRKLMRAEALPSVGLVSVLATIFRWNAKDTRELVKLDKARSKFGAEFWRFVGKDPSVEPFYIMSPYLTDEEREFFLARMRHCINRREGQRGKRQRRRLSA
jgi:hypothetical protein